MKDETINQLQKFKNIQFVKADISDEFETGIENINNVILVSSIGNTDAKLYKRFWCNQDKNCEVSIRIFSKSSSVNFR